MKFLCILLLFVSGWGASLQAQPLKTAPAKQAGKQPVPMRKLPSGSLALPIKSLSTEIELEMNRLMDKYQSYPNTDTTWRRIRWQAENFLYGLFRQGRLMGTKSEQAYFVRMDRTTMTQDDLLAGIKKMEMGYAPTKPGEFIIRVFTRKYP